MSVTLERPPTSWQARPGWGIAIDLTPRQVVAARQVKVHQRLIALALLLVLLLCVAVSLLVRADRSSAEDAYAEEQTRTVGLAAEGNQYADITAMQAATTRVQGDLTTLMGTDVDVVNLLARVNVDLPPGVLITDQAVVLNPPVEAVPAAAAPEATEDGAPDPAAAPVPAPAAPAGPTGAVIGLLTLSGTADQIASVTTFVSSLNRLDGAVDVLPTNVARTETGVTYTITANLTDVLLTGRYAAEAP